MPDTTIAIIPDGTVPPIPLACLVAEKLRAANIHTRAGEIEAIMPAEDDPTHVMIRLAGPNPELTQAIRSVLDIHGLNNTQIIYLGTHNGQTTASDAEG